MIICVGGVREWAKREVQKRIQDQTDGYWREKISSLIIQGDFLSLISEEGSNVTWKSYLWGLPRGVAKFAVNSGLNTLPSGDNLRRWGKRVGDTCALCNCNAKQTLNHILSSCRVSLEQGRFTWRHDSVLRTLFQSIRGHLRDGYTMFLDISGHQASGGSVIPPEVIATSQRPDVVVVNMTAKDVIIFELTCPFDNNIDTAHAFKMEKYSSLVTDLESLGFKVDLFCVEVSVRGQVTKSNRARLKSFLFRTTGVRKCTDFIVKMSRASLLSSFSIFCARNEQTWQTDHGITL